MANKTEVLERGLILVNTGDGKGKTTAALGTVFRALGYGYDVGVIQFAKGNWTTGERLFAEELSKINLSGKLNWHCGPVEKGPWLSNNSEVSNEKLAEELMTLAQGMVAKKEIRLLILDEFNIALDKGYIAVNEFIVFLEDCRRRQIDVVITGRNAPQALIDFADTVTVMEEKKHAFKAGVLAKKGVDY